MMRCVQTRVWGTDHRDWPLRDHGAFFQINDRNVTFAIHNLHGHVQTLSRWLDCDARRITAGQLNAAYQLGRFGINDIDGRVVGSMITLRQSLRTSTQA